MVNQLKCQMVGDAKELLEACLPKRMHLWIEIKGYRYFSICRYRHKTCVRHKGITKYECG